MTSPLTPLSPSGSAASLLSVDLKVVLLAFATAALTTGGLFFQKLNEVRSGGHLFTGWLVLSLICFIPTFFITNLAFQMGGRMSLYVPVTAAQYALTILAGRFYFNEAVGWDKWAGCALILAGVAAIARG
jgi:drug/metabolite transporter (DMT)-like permease